MYNDLHYKIALMDLSPCEKNNKYISYESGRRKIFEELVDKEEFNINIICNKYVNIVSYSNYYLCFFIFYLITLIILYLIIKKLNTTK